MLITDRERVGKYEDTAATHPENRIRGQYFETRTAESIASQDAMTTMTVLP